MCVVVLCNHHLTVWLFPVVSNTSDEEIWNNSVEKQSVTYLGSRPYANLSF